jgi:DNA-binding GntR family transcriptional regulator
MDADRIHSEHRAVTVPESPQVERAYQNIKVGIVRGRYPPGAPLSEVSLAREHGMSRTPVREGLARLWQERYLDRVVGHGYFVARVTVQSIHDTFDVRRLLEGAAAARAAERATADEIETMRRLAIMPISVSAQNLDGANDYREAEAANARFHMAIASAARNTLAQELVERCLAQVDRFMSLGVQFGPFQEGATAAHLEIVDAIGRRDPVAAKARMEEHLDCGSQRMKDMLLRGQFSAVGVD